jgi:RHH-type proline utilization regulon transcriptional repressor/proline dehydrogenase/delta 1-pyrroline-5-carboxylate dehydrogenase
MSNLATWQVPPYIHPMTTFDETAGPSTAEQLLPVGIGDDAVALARRWAHEASSAPSTGSAHLLAQVLKDESGLAFTIGFVDRVVRPEDLGVAARNLSTLASQVPAFLPWHMRTAVRLGGVMAPVLPGVVVPIARRVLRGMVGHLVADARPAKLGAAIASIRRDRTRLNLNLLGEAVLGDAEAEPSTGSRAPGPCWPATTSTTCRSRSRRSSVSSRCGPSTRRSSASSRS